MATVVFEQFMQGLIDMATISKMLLINGTRLCVSVCVFVSPAVMCVSLMSHRPRNQSTSGPRRV